MKARLPDAMVGDKSTMYEAFIRCAAKYDDEKAYAVELLKLLPQPLKEAPVWFDKMTKLWRYEYGLPYDRLPEQTVISGTNVHLPAEELYSAIRIADERLRRDQLLRFLERLSDREKHSDVLFEMRPMKDVKANWQTNYEVSGLGIGNTTLDWQVKGRLINVVFDVKNRTKSFIEYMKRIIPDIKRGAESIRPSPPNPEDLFKSVEDKLKDRCYFSQLQGVWVHLEIQEEEDKLTLYFNKILNRRKVHFAVLSDWKNDAFILARNRIIVSLLKKIFGLIESKRFVSCEYR